MAHTITAVTCWSVRWLALRALRPDPMALPQKRRQDQGGGRSRLSGGQLNSRLHEEAMLAAAKDGTIDYVFSEGVAGTDYPRAMREYAEQGFN